MALVLPDGREFTRRGEVSGRLLERARGENGFGYDPLFVPDGYEVTTAELDAAAKDAISHRGKAVRAIVAVLADVVAGRTNVTGEA
jgi:XTP/dITP diphosphohydrolase